MFIFTIIIFCFSIIKPVFASNEFDVDQQISYAVNSSGQAKVTHQIVITNKISQIFAREYQLSIHNTKIESITAHDQYGDIINKVDREADKTIINLKFAQPVVGKDQINRFTLNYNITDFAIKKGSTWEVGVPQFDDKLANPKLDINLTVPSSFGDLSFSSIPTYSTHLVDNQNSLQFKPLASTGKLLFIFGNSQIFDFKLLYYLKNDRSTSQYLEIPIPPDTNNQTITFHSLEPLPQSTRVDQDGNWLAQYHLEPGQEVDIVIIGQAKTHPSKKRVVKINPENYLLPQKYWETDNSQLQILKNSLSTPKAIYDYTTSTLTYDYDQINSSTRKGALSTINNPANSLCTEFTDLFVTMSRIIKVPAREIEGYAYSNNSKIKPTNLGTDILHAWPEYYDSQSQTWVQIDPTWGKTTNGIDYFHDLDLNHITFVIHGIDSQSPPPPGSYKRSPSTKTVFVDFAKTALIPDSKNPSINLDKNTLTVINPNYFSLATSQISLQNSNWKEIVEQLPPLGIQTITIPYQNFFISILPASANYVFDLEIDGQKIPYRIVNRQHYLNLAIFIGSIIFLLCIGGIILTTNLNKNEKNH